MWRRWICLCALLVAAATGPATAQDKPMIEEVKARGVLRAGVTTLSSVFCMRFCAFPRTETFAMGLTPRCCAKLSRFIS